MLTSTATHLICSLGARICTQGRVKRFPPRHPACLVHTRIPLEQRNPHRIGRRYRVPRRRMGSGIAGPRCLCAFVVRGCGALTCRRRQTPLGRAPGHRGRSLGESGLKVRCAVFVARVVVGDLFPLRHGHRQGTRKPPVNGVQAVRVVTNERRQRRREYGVGHVRCRIKCSLSTLIFSSLIQGRALLSPCAAIIYSSRRSLQHVQEENASLAGVSSFLSSAGDGWGDVPYQG